ncbi:MAG: hypothetical protein M3O46_02930 [Myxococcota bacterium]|nr:hypothetical protein [Myxococcota bacterium]
MDVHAERDAGKLIVSGSVVDDAARPVVGARVAIAIARASDAPTPVVPTAPTFEACDGVNGSPEMDGRGRVILATDDVARFCVKLPLAKDRYVARIEALTSGFVDGATLDLPLDFSLPTVTLRFDPERPVVSLDDETSSFEVTASTEDERVTAPAGNLLLSLSNESGVALGRVITDLSGRARFVVAGALLGAPGDGQLNLAFAGNGIAGAATRTMRVQRRTQVEVIAPDAHNGHLPEGSPEDGIALRLMGTTRCARYGCTGLASGTFEVSAGQGDVLGAAPLDHGEAHLLLDFVPTTAGTEQPLTIRYIPDGPWFQPAGDLFLVQPVRSPNPWKKVPLVLAATAVVGWLALARSPLRMPARRRRTRPAEAAHDGPQVQVVRSAPPSHGWTGFVVDAHDGVAVADIRVAIERPGFEGVDVVAQTSSGRDGAFAIAPVDTLPGDELVAGGRQHATLRGRLPPSSELTIALALRKRVLLDRLVSWARRRGAPYDSPGEPTPGYVHRAAGSDVAIARWARATEQAAYGGTVVDKHIQEDVDRLAPKDAENG